MRRGGWVHGVYLFLSFEFWCMAWVATAARSFFYVEQTGSMIHVKRLHMRLDLKVV